MIRSDGYYIDKPTPYEDGIANFSEKGYFHHAYYFLPNGYYLRSVKKSQYKKVDFSEQDFNHDFPNKYDVKAVIR